MKAKGLIIFLLIGLFIVGFDSVVFPQEKYPDRDIQIIVPFGAGGASDLCFRSLTGELAKILKVPVNVINRTGAGGLVGADAVANAKPDGYTLLGTSSAVVTVAPAIDPKALRDLDPVALIAHMPIIIATRSESEFKSLEDVVSYAKKKPGDLTCATSGIQTETYFSFEIFKSTAGIKIKHVPIPNSAEALNNLLGGHINFYCGSYAATYSLMKAGRIRGLAFTRDGRVDEFPDLPTFAERGFPQVNVKLIITLMGPKGLPPIVNKTWQDALKVVLKNTEVITSLNKLHYNIDLQTDTGKISEYLKREFEIFSRIAEETGIRK
jgi:tripartite-type tricarboxylate transporter receptor subunit TctC